ncbi:hypothetical protein SKAU_G00117550 [Synaphobranchus kaupii]|uniref:Uncharacterized protein n=1 Tax=Synaphobranchus kaupii TaxID=118154 RepID=A0A9Q1FN79_SYNKA|nr:hypothetical protein SKAU_G00117550 [Synaphobranchus kaupii]
MIEVGKKEATGVQDKAAVLTQHLQGALSPHVWTGFSAPESNCTSNILKFLLDTEFLDILHRHAPAHDFPPIGRPPKMSASNEESRSLASDSRRTAKESCE